VLKSVVRSPTAVHSAKHSLFPRHTYSGTSAPAFV
jgi:hypothetical protein